MQVVYAGMDKVKRINHLNQTRYKFGSTKYYTRDVIKLRDSVGVHFKVVMSQLTEDEASFHLRRIIEEYGCHPVGPLLNTYVHYNNVPRIGDEIYSQLENKIQIQDVIDAHRLAERNAEQAYLASPEYAEKQAKLLAQRKTKEETERTLRWAAFEAEVAAEKQARAQMPAAKKFYRNLASFAFCLALMFIMTIALIGFLQSFGLNAKTALVAGLILSTYPSLKLIKSTWAKREL
jgi:hypothetical protein